MKALLLEGPVLDAYTTESKDVEAPAVGEVGEGWELLQCAGKCRQGFLACDVA